jgi:hypothetical protein
MNRRIVMLSIALISILFASVYLSPASAATITWNEHASIVGEGIQVDAPGYTPAEGVRFSFAHFADGDHGIRDNMGVYLYGSVPKRWLLAAWLSDTDEGYAYISALMAGAKTIVIQVKPNELQVRGMGDNNGIGRWTMPIEIPAVPSIGTPAITIPPGHITLKAYGDLRTGSTPPTLYTWSGYTFSGSWTGHSATGNFVCDEWNYDGATSTGTTITGTIDTTLRTDIYQRATK